MSRDRLPPPQPEACLTMSRASRYKGGTIIAEDVWSPEEHIRRMSSPDGYRPEVCGRCGSDRLHVHDYPERKPLGVAMLAALRVVRFICANPSCGATWRVLPAFLARHLWWVWRRVERATTLPAAPACRRPRPKPRLRPRRRWPQRRRAHAHLSSPRLQVAAQPRVKRSNCGQCRNGPGTAGSGGWHPRRGSWWCCSPPPGPRWSRPWRSRSTWTRRAGTSSKPTEPCAESCRGQGSRPWRHWWTAWNGGSVSCSAGQIPSAVGTRRTSDHDPTVCGGRRRVASPPWTTTSDSAWRSGGSACLGR